MALLKIFKTSFLVRTSNTQLYAHLKYARVTYVGNMLMYYYLFEIQVILHNGLY